MLNTNPILIIGLDDDDFQTIQHVCESAKFPNEIIHIKDGNEGIEYLRTHEEKPFMVLSDVYIPGMSGLDFRKTIEEDHDLRSKSVPFIFLAESLMPKQVTAVYEMSVQGLFDKPSSINELEKMMKLIYDYWQLCRHPDQS